MLDTTHAPPAAPRDDENSRDPYAWLRDRKDPRTLAHLTAENEYAERVMEPTSGRRERLYDEMRGRIKETDSSAPVRWGDWLYYTRTEEGKQYPIHCRRGLEDGAAEQILLDQNELAEGHDYFHLGAFEVSPDHMLAAYSVDLDGGETYTMHVKDLRSGELLPDVLQKTYDSAEWANDNRTLFYNTLDEAHRPCKVWRHRLGTGQAQDVLLYHEEDERFFLGIFKTKSRRFVGIHLGSHTTSEVHLLDADAEEGSFERLRERRQGVEYSVDHGQGRFYILTNDAAVNFRLLAVPADDPRAENEVELLPHDPEVKLDYVEAFRDHVVLTLRKDGLRGIRVIRAEDWSAHEIALDEEVYTVGTGANPEFDSRSLRFVYSSPVMPTSVFEYDMETRERELKKRTEVPGGYDPADYECRRLNVEAADGALVPLSLVYRKGRSPNAPGPLMLYGYGAYGSSTEPTFDPGRLCLLDRGFVWAIAHVRGGGEKGRPWYEDGKLLNKRNSFTDFIACAERLIADGWTTPAQLAIRGGSAGGLLVGAVTNMRPELFRVVVAKVPFVDVVNTMSDPSLPLTVIEYEEWGNPGEPEARERIAAYSPYENITETAYPDLLVTAGLNDPRVGFWEPAKWAARLRERRTDDGLLLLKTEMGAGHGGPSGRYEYLKELAFEFAFVLERLGVQEPVG